MSSVDTNKADTQIRLARSYAAKHAPWFSSALFRARIVLTMSVPVAAIDEHYNCYWNPAVILMISNSSQDKIKVLEELSFIWLHEIAHVLREHSARNRAIKGNAKRWNYAADLEINDALWNGTQHPTLFPPLLPQQFNLPIGKTAEWYYKNLPENTFEYTIPWDDGSACHGEGRPWEIMDTDKQILNGISQSIIRREVAKNMKINLAGTAPGSWGIWVEHTLNPKIDWRKVLKKRLSTAIAMGRGSKIDYTFSRPNRRASIYYPFLLPSLTGTNNGSLTVVIDTSGSMNGEPIKHCMAEVYGILKQVHQKVWLIPCDAIDYEPILLKSTADLLRLVQLPGGGGTNMIEGVEAALRMEPAPDTVLVLTDGYTPYPTQLYDTPVVWGIIQQGASSPSILPPPPWPKDAIIEIIV